MKNTENKVPESEGLIYMNFSIMMKAFFQSHKLGFGKGIGFSSLFLLQIFHENSHSTEAVKDFLREMLIQYNEMNKNEDSPFKKNK